MPAMPACHACGVEMTPLGPGARVYACPTCHVIRVRCPRCDRSMRAVDDGRYACHDCRLVVILPEPSPPPAVEDTSEAGGSHAP